MAGRAAGFIAAKIVLLAVAIIGLVFAAPGVLIGYILLTSGAPFQPWDLLAGAGVACALVTLVLSINALREFSNADIRSLWVFGAAAVCGVGCWVFAQWMAGQLLWG